MPKHHEKTTYVSEISAMIEAFIRNRDQVKELTQGQA